MRPAGTTTPPAFGASVPFDAGSKKENDEAIVGSPLKKARASLSGLDGEMMGRRLGLGGPGQGLGQALGLGLGLGVGGGALGLSASAGGDGGVKREEVDEEL